MRKVRKGTIIEHDCYIITVKEKEEYTQAMETLSKLKEMADNYRKQYKS